MAAPKRTHAQRESDLAETSRLYCSGWRQVDIAERLGVSQAQVSLDLKAIFADWRKARDGNVTEWTNAELARINTLELEYWEAWRRSCADRKRTVKGARTGPVASTNATVTEETMLGNPAYLAGVQWCIERRCKILGIDAPVKVRHGGDPDNPTPIQSEVKLTAKVVTYDEFSDRFATLFLGDGAGSVDDGKRTAGDESGIHPA